jgi:CheY-like chemotaxis protein
MTRPAVLVVEDDRDTREIIAEILRAGGHEVRSAGNGLEALQVLERDASVGLVLLDLMMPVMDGWQFLAARRNLRPEREVPVVVLSATPEAVSAVDVDRVLAKPIEMESLLAVVAEHLR